MSELESNIHSTAIIEEGAVIGNNVTIEPHVVIKGSVRIEDDVTIKSFCYIDGNTTIGQGTTLYPSVCIGTKTQDRKFEGETTYVRIGKNCEIREYVTINSSCQEGSTVSIGDDCLIMACCHVAHNCSLGDRVIMSNNTVLAGHVTIEDDAVIGGMTAIHQFARIGCFAMVGGMSRVTHDVPPFSLGGGVPYKFGGINRVGLLRHNFPAETRAALVQAFKITYRSGLHLEEALELIAKELDSIPEIRHWIEFCRTSKRGLLGIQGATQLSNEDLDLDLDNDEALSAALKEKISK
ncbi:MAG: acyl-[acyl-carrier-protein]--UDP-N-acetylglucosamine O-acyltransferase [Waddliaceae bacterium]|nr:acyl-[acyl-carrier-protein]--UDP-N-acetylglucosamine O-acyltransferase [Waddliaceae bacterium]